MVPASVRHLDLVATVLLALAVGVLGAFDVVGPAITGGATLTTLGLLAASSLNGRSQLQTLTTTCTELSRQHLNGRCTADRLLSVSTSGVGLELSEANDIRIIGVTLARTIRNHHVMLQRRLEAGAAVRIALIEPGGGTVEEAARRSTIPGRPEIFEHRLLPTIDLLRELAVAAAGHPGRLEIRLLGFVPAVGMIAVDADKPHGHLHVDIYSHRPGGPDPTLPLYAAQDQQWFRHFTGEFDRIWATGRPFVATDQR